MTLVLYGLGLLHILGAGCLMLYGMNCYVMITLHRWRCRQMLRHDTVVQQEW